VDFLRDDLREVLVMPINFSRSNAFLNEPKVVAHAAKAMHRDGAFVWKVKT
jgi:hypothetical protein